MKNNGNMETPKWNFDLLAKRAVYEPAEDTFLLLDALEDDLKNLIERKPLIVLEIGSGSGVVITAIAHSFMNATYCIAVDINMKACDVTRNTAHLNGVNIDIIHSSLLEAIDLREIIDVIIFNPPYVETEDCETLEKGIAQSWAGGSRGRLILDKLLPSLNKAISEQGVFYLVAINYNEIDDVMERMQNIGFNGVILKERQLRGELLYVLKFAKCSSLI